LTRDESMAALPKIVNLSMDKTVKRKSLDHIKVGRAIRWKGPKPLTDIKKQ